MRSPVALAVAVSVALLAAPARAQQGGDDWDTPAFGGQQQAPPPPADDSDALPPPPLGELIEEDEDEWRGHGSASPGPEPLVEEDRWRRGYVQPSPSYPLDSVTVLGGRAIGKGRSAVTLTAGYPYITLRYLRGLHARLDLGVSAKTFYGAMTEAALEARWELLRLGSLSLAANGSLGGAFFLRPARSDGSGGARWVTGRRHINGELGGVISMVPEDGRGLHPFLDARYLLALDLEPTMTDPLGGIPPPVQFGGNTLLRMGLEVPLSARATVSVAAGLDLHGRQEDSRVFFNFAFGVAGVF